MIRTLVDARRHFSKITSINARSLQMVSNRFVVAWANRETMSRTLAQPLEPLHQQDPTLRTREVDTLSPLSRQRQ